MLRISKTYRVIAIALTLVVVNKFFGGPDEYATNKPKRYLKSKSSKSSSKSSKSSKSLKSSKSASRSSSSPRVVSMWWVIFNRPEKCANYAAPVNGLKCTYDDLIKDYGDDPDPKIGFIHASGGISDNDGNVHMVSTLYRTSTNCGAFLDLNNEEGVCKTCGGPATLYDPDNPLSYGYCNNIGRDEIEGDDVEVHIVIRDHGPPVKNTLRLKNDQMTLYTDPSCKSEGGKNTCVNSGYYGIPPITGDETESGQIGRYPGYQKGCAKDETCTTMEEKVQLKEGRVVVTRTDDSFQVIINLKIPSVYGM